MTHHQFRAALKRLELSQLGASRLFGYDARTVRHWALGESAVPPAVVILLRLMLNGRLSIEDVEAARTKRRTP